MTGGITIQNEKTYYNQKSVIHMIHEETGYSSNVIANVLNALEDMVKDKFSAGEQHVEIKIFPGLKVTSKYIPSDQSVSKRLHITSDYSIFMSASFTDDFRKKIRELHIHST